jgi:hypothetical protein
MNQTQRSQHCRYCRFHQVQGRQRGSCQLLKTPMSGQCKACRLFVPVFEPI